MSYYIVSEEDGKILESQDSMSDEEIQDAADYFGCDVYAIRGEHSGYSAVCSAPVESITPPEVTAALAEIEPLGPGITSDEGQRAYTEAEVQELLEAERERVLKALRKVVSGYGYRWNAKMANGLVSKVEIEFSEAKHA